MSLLFLFHNLQKPLRLATPQFTRRSLSQEILGFLVAPVAESVRKRARRTTTLRRDRLARDPDSCHAQLMVI